MSDGKGIQNRKLTITFSIGIVILVGLSCAGE